MTRTSSFFFAILFSIWQTQVWQAPVSATWSVVAADTRTGEVAIASATCLTGIDLAELSPVMVVGRGGATAQSSIDADGSNRATIYDGLLDGRTAQQILDQLAATDPAHQSRQYGITETAGSFVTFTGTNTGSFAGGRIGVDGDLVYAVQGNVLTGDPVVARAEQALLQIEGDLPLRVMASMLAAYRMGGDGRCSCSLFDPTGCGSPPESFEKSAHVGFLMVSRKGDTDGGCDVFDGCADGDYYLRLNVANQGNNDPDPVLQLRDQFIADRQSRRGHADHYASQTVLSPAALPADGISVSTATVTVRDWRGDDVGVGGAAVDVRLAPESTTSVGIGTVLDNGDGTYSFDLTASRRPGTARLVIVVDDGTETVQLAPDASLVLE